MEVTRLLLLLLWLEKPTGLLQLEELIGPLRLEQMTGLLLLLTGLLWLEKLIRLLAAGGADRAVVAREADQTVAASSLEYLSQINLLDPQFNALICVTQRNQLSNNNLIYGLDAQ